jgi:hypothetical protein
MRVTVNLLLQTLFARACSCTVCCVSKNYTHLKLQTTTADFVASSIVLPIGKFALDRAWRHFAILLFFLWALNRHTTEHRMDGDHTLTALNSWPTLLIALTPLFPITPCAINLTWQDLAEPLLGKLLGASAPPVLRHYFLKARSCLHTLAAGL